MSALQFPKAASDKKALEEGSVFSPRFDAAGLVTAVVTDAEDGKLLMVAHMVSIRSRPAIMFWATFIYGKSSLTRAVVFSAALTLVLSNSAGKPLRTFLALLPPPAEARFLCQSSVTTARLDQVFFEILAISID